MPSVLSVKNSKDKFHPRLCYFIHFLFYDGRKKMGKVYYLELDELLTFRRVWPSFSTLALDSAVMTYGNGRLDYQ